MPSLFRPLLASVLCSVIVFGHVPVWMHVAVCGGHEHAATKLAANSADAADTGFRDQSRPGCSHDCQHHAVADRASDHSHDSSRPSDQEPHDSDTCHICQSLAGAVGVNWDLLVSLPAGYHLHSAVFAAESLTFGTLLSFPQPRGPPVAA